MRHNQIRFEVDAPGLACNDERMNGPKSVGFDAFASAELRAQAAAHRVTQEAITRATGISPSTLGRYFSGRRAMPIGAMAEIAEVIGVSPATVIQGALARQAREAAHPDVDLRKHVGLDELDRIDEAARDDEQGHGLP